MAWWWLMACRSGLPDKPGSPAIDKIFIRPLHLHKEGIILFFI
jgi:hypothetical protein